MVRRRWPDLSPFPTVCTRLNLVGVLRACLCQQRPHSSFANPDGTCASDCPARSRHLPYLYYRGKTRRTNCSLWYTSFVKRAIFQNRKDCPGAAILTEGRSPLLSKRWRLFFVKGCPFCDCQMYAHDLHIFLVWFVTFLRSKFWGIVHLVIK